MIITGLIVFVYPTYLLLSNLRYAFIYRKDGDWEYYLEQAFEDALFICFMILTVIFLDSCNR